MPDNGTMRAAAIDAVGPPDRLRITELPVPVAGPGEVLVRVRAAGVNAIDWATRAGEGVPIGEFPAVLGWDVAGTVVGTGPGVTAFGDGDDVFGMPRFPALAGCYAEYVTAPESELAGRPATVDNRTAAGAAMVALTAWQSLFEHADLGAGQRVLVHGAAGGVGHVAVQLAKLAGAEVIATASARNHDFLRELGADDVVDYTVRQPADVVAGIDVVVDPRGGSDFVRLTGVLRPGGVIVTLKGEQPGHRDHAAAAGARAAFTYVHPDGPVLDRIARLLADGSLRIAVDRTFPLADAAAAHALGEQGHVRGRLVLDVG
ncbi:MAG TPA: NADP-dependent oxidoreductase [Pseudonocardiaceae bacterium]|nr:NADP-dependent oxidoreductase [Pseudonocardiaceae bacterium]